MGLINRIAGIPEDPQRPEEVRRIPVDTFWALLYEMSNGERTLQNIVDRFELDEYEQGDLSWLISRYNAQPNATAKAKFIELMRVIFMLAESKEPGYTTNFDISARVGRI